MKNLKRLFVTLLITLISPLAVYAADLTIDSKSYDENTYEFKVSGSSTFSEVMVSLFDGDELLSFKTVSTTNNKYNATFDITFEQDKVITIKVGDINSNDYEMATLEVKKSVTHLKNVLTDEEGNQLIIKGANSEFEDNQHLDVNIYSMDDINEMLEMVKGTPQEEEFTEAFNVIKFALGEKELLLYIEAFVKDDRDNNVDFNSHMSGFTLKLKLPKEVYNSLGSFKVVPFNDDATLGEELQSSYDENEEVFTINIDKPGMFMVYKYVEEAKPVDATKENNPKTGDNIMIYVSLLGVSVVGLIGLGIYKKKKA